MTAIAAIKTSGQFSLHLDESSNAQLMAYIRYRGLKDMEEEFLLCRPLLTNTTGEYVFKNIHLSRKKNLHVLSDAMSVVTVHQRF